jgi:hypothetical protein
VLVLWKDGYSPSESEQKYLEDAWRDAVKLKTHPEAQHSAMVSSKDRQMVPSVVDQEEDQAADVLNAVLETYKYSIKSAELQVMPLGVFKILDDLLRGRRMVAFGGIVKKYAAELGLSDHMDTDASNDDAAVDRCTACKSVKLIQIVGQWTGDGYLWRRTPAG